MMHSYAPGCEKLQGFYRGIVLKHMSNGKCKIWIPTIHPEEWNSYEKADLLPSAEQASPISFGTNNGLGIFSYPNIGSIVWCFFENGDQNLPVYFASSLGGPAAIQQWDSSRRMVGSHPEDAFVHSIHVRNSDIEINEVGMISVCTRLGENSTNLVLDQDGNIKIDSTMNVNIHSKQIALSADTQLDISSPNIKVQAQTQLYEASPAIHLDSSQGHTKITSRACNPKYDGVVQVF